MEFIISLPNKDLQAKGVTVPFQESLPCKHKQKERQNHYDPAFLKSAPYFNLLTLITHDVGYLPVRSCDAVP